MRECDVTVLKILVRSDYRTQCKYLIKRGCCGEEIEINHVSLYQKKKRRQRLCKNCAYGRSQKGEKKQEIEELKPVQPVWVPPPSALKKRNLR
jgi:hypothetical protein